MTGFDMRTLAALLMVAALALGSQGAVVKDGPTHREQAARIMALFNDYLDQIQPQIQSFFVINGLDPFQSPDIVRTISVTDLLGIVWHGDLSLTEGWIQDLSTVHRSGDALASYDNMILVIDAVMGFNDIIFDYSYLAQVMDIGPTGGLSGKVTDLSMVVQITADLNTMALSLQKLDIVHAGTVDVTLEGNLLDFVANAIIDLTITIFHDTLINVVKDAIFTEVQKFVASINLYDIINGAGP